MSSLTTKFKLPTSIVENGEQRREVLPVRVKEVILDKSHPEYDKYGKVDSIGAIKYARIDRKINTSDTKTLPVAFPISNHNLTLPLVNEIVLLVLGPKQDKRFETKAYYFSIVGLYNDVNFIPSYDEKDEGSTLPGYDFIENNKIRPLHPYNGDTILQGRNGQSIRLGGAPSPKNTITQTNDKNKPFTLISNGHKELGEGELYTEDINVDSSSIYLTSDHVIPLKQSRTTFVSLDTKPTVARNYKGAQIILNSGRLIFNSTDENISFSSNKFFSINSERTIIEAEKEIGLDAKKIYLGETARVEPIEPVVKGLQLELFLEALLNVLESTGSAMKTAKTVDQKVIPELNIQGTVLEQVTKGLKNRLDLLKSKKVFTE